MYWVSLLKSDGREYYRPFDDREDAETYKRSHKAAAPDTVVHITRMKPTNARPENTYRQPDSERLTGRWMK